MICKKGVNSSLNDSFDSSHLMGCQQSGIFSSEQPRAQIKLSLFSFGINLPFCNKSKRLSRCIHERLVDNCSGSFAGRLNDFASLNSLMKLKYSSCSPICSLIFLKSG